MSFFAELKRRRVFRVLGVYLVAAWAIIQASDTIFPRLNLPAWSVTLVIALVAIAFPIVVILAWVFDVKVDVDRTTPTETTASLTAARIAAAGGVIILAGAGLAFYTSGKADLSAQRVAVSVFENRTGDKQFDALGRMTSDDIVRGLSETGEVQVADDHAGVTVSGSVYRENGEVRLIAQVKDARTGQIMRTIGPVKTPEEMRDLATGGIVALVSPSGQGFIRVSEGAHLPNWAAYRYYLKGVEGFTNVDFKGSADNFSRSYAADTLFLLAVIRQAYALQNSVHPEQVDSIAAWFEPRRERLSAFESAYLDRVVARSHGELAGVYRASHEMLRLRPTSGNAHYIAGRDAMPLNRPAEAIREFKKIDLKDPELPQGREIFADYSSAYHMLGDYRKALKWTDRGLERVAGDLTMNVHKAVNLAALGRLDEMTKVADDLELQTETATNNPGTAFITISNELNVHGHKEEAKDMAGRALAWLNAHDGPLAARFNAAVIAGDLDEAARIVAGDTSKAYARRGILAALKGDRTEAMRYSELLAADTTTITSARRDRGTRLSSRARIAAVLGDKPTAVRLMREAAASGVAFNTQLHADFVLSRLRGYKPYDDFMKPKD